jgi:hypothetical protein
MKKKKIQLRTKIKNRPKSRHPSKKKKPVGQGPLSAEEPQHQPGQEVDEGLDIMSRVILDFAGPLLDTCDDIDAEKKAISLAIFVWNATLLPEPEKKRTLEGYLSACEEALPAQELETLSGLIGRLVQDKSDRFADNRNKITNCTFGDYGDDRHIEVGYTIA